MMKFTLSTFLAIAVATAFASPLSARQKEGVEEAWENNPLVQNSSNPDLLRRLRAVTQDVRQSGCAVNLCFALQGNDFIDNLDFQNQQNFVDLIVAILGTDDNAAFCAVQYGLTTGRISPLTDNRETFLRRLHGAHRVGGKDNNIAAALVYAGFQLRPHLQDPNKLIIFGDGLETVGAEPTNIANRIREDGTEICAVAVGDFSLLELQNITADPSRVLSIHDFFEIAEIVDGLVRQVCGLQK